MFGVGKHAQAYLKGTILKKTSTSKHHELKENNTLKQ